MAKDQETVMATFSRVIGAVKDAKDSITRWLERMFPTLDDRIPTDADDQKEALAAWVKQVYEDSRKWRERSFKGRRNILDPRMFWAQARKIEGGLHWDVWGRRNDKQGDGWKQELVDSETENQVRMRKSYLAGAWHDITVSPNIKQISDIMDDERAKTAWTDMTIMGIHTGMVDGTAHFKELLDKSEDPRGISRTIVVDNASCFPTPYSTGLKKIEGCWSFVYATQQTQQMVLETYPKLDRSEFTMASSDIAKDILIEGESDDGLGNLTHTKLCDVLECYFDDPIIEKIPSPEGEIEKEHTAFALDEAEDLASELGVNPDRPPAKDQVHAKVEEGQNHVEHVEAHIAWLEQYVGERQVDSVMNEATADGSVTDEELVQRIQEKVLKHIAEHRAAVKVAADQGIPSGYRRKYPSGRKVTVVSGVVADDENIQETYGFDWRRLWRKWDVERLPGHYWGRGLVEVMMDTNKVLDTMLSRTADAAILTAGPKPWFHEEDADTLTEHPYNNDPAEPGFYRKSEPVFPQGHAPKENMELYSAFKADAGKKFGIGDVTYGEAPSAASSGKLVDILLEASKVIVSGEANQRLNAVLEDIVETKLMMFKRFYTEPRWFFIQGQPEAINVSDVLKVFTVRDDKTGKEEEREVPEFQIRVSPNSNFPRAWEIAFTFLAELSQLQTDDGVSLVPRKALADLLASRHPKLAPGGEYYREAEVTALGKKVAAQMQAKQEAEAKTLDKVRERFVGRGTDEILKSKPSTGGDNGEAQAVGQEATL